MKREIHRGYGVCARRGLIDAGDQGFPAEFVADIATSGKLRRAGGDNRGGQVELGLGGDPLRVAVVYCPVDPCRRDSLRTNRK